MMAPHPIHPLTPVSPTCLDRVPAGPRRVSAGSLHLCTDQPGTNLGLYANESETLSRVNITMNLNLFVVRGLFFNHKSQPIQRVPLQHPPP